MDHLLVAVVAAEGVTRRARNQSPAPDVRFVGGESLRATATNLGGHS